MIHVMRINEMASINNYKSYSVMYWLDVPDSLVNKHPEIDNWEQVVSGGEQSTLEFLLALFEDFSEKYNISIEIKTPTRVDNPECFVYIDGVHIGSFIMTNNEQILNVLRNALNAKKWDMVKVE